VDRWAARIEMLDAVVSAAVPLGFGLCDAQDTRLDGRTIRVDGRDLVSFASCSYLGLEMDPRVKQGAIDAIERFGTQFSSSRIYVSAPPYAELEAKLGTIFDAHVIAAPSTTLAHLAAIPTLVDERDAIVIDHQAHHSIQTACNQARVLGTSVELLRHSRMDLLEQRLRELSPHNRHVWYMVDGIYSMYGDLAPFDELSELLDRFEQLHLYVDDAHGMSWCGKNGRGMALDRMSLHPRMVLATSLNKSFAAAGAALVFPDDEVRRKIRTCGGPLLFSGPIQPPMLGAALASARIHLSEEIGELQQRLRERIAFCSRELEGSSFPVLSSGQTPIFFVGVGTTRTAQQLTARLFNEGFYLNCGQFPAVPMRGAGLRFGLSLHQTEDDVKRLVEAIEYSYEDVLQQEGETLADAWSSFGLDAPESRSQRPSPRPADLHVERSDTIDEVPEREWDACLGGRGAFDWQGMRFLEDLFRGRKEPESDWRFHYYRVADARGRTLLATFFTDALWKADMLAPAAVSRKVEALRARDPLHLSARVFSMGALLTEGNHLYLAEPPSSPASEQAIAMLLAAVREDVPEGEADMVVLRDLPGDDPVMDRLLLDQGFLKLPAPESLSVDLTWNDDEEFLARLSRKFRRHQKGAVYPFNDSFELEVLRDGKGTDGRRPESDELARLRELYQNVKSRSFELNTFDLPEDTFDRMIDSPPWEVLVLRPSGGATAPPVAVVGCYAGIDVYVPTVIGLDYRWVYDRGLYRQCLRHILARARELQRARVLFGMGASLEKRRFGAQATRNALYVQINDTYAFDAVSQMSAEE
jgi:7-keto-8-aminopelargonate synthetase-like enzyme